MTPLPPEDLRLPCATNPDRQFPSAKQPAAIEAAKRVCLTGDAGRPCGFLTECRTYALRHAVEGIWAGTDAGERKALRARMGIVPQPLTVPTALARGVPAHGTPARYRRHLRAGEDCRECREGYMRWQNPSQAPLGRRTA